MSAGSSKAEQPAEPPNPKVWWERSPPIYFGAWFSNLVHRGELFITEDGHTSHYTDLDLKANLSLLNLGQPQQKVKVNIVHLGITTPQGRAELDTRLTYGCRPGQARPLEPEAGRSNRGLLAGGGLPSP